MCKHILKTFMILTIATLTMLSKGFSQPCTNGISTNPNNPVNDQFLPLMNQWYPDTVYSGTGTDTHNPFLNTYFNWYLGGGTTFLYPGSNSWDHQWSGNPDSVAMLNPYSGSMPDEFSYLRPDSIAASNRDYRWEDGWELLWMNMGYYPDGSSILNPSSGSYYANHSEYYDPLPSDIPYYILYNRYRGLMRVIANVWYDNANYQNVEVVLKFPFSSVENKNITGILRHASAIDLPLDQPTNITAIHSPRYRIPSLTQWMVADFQIGYDPCTCISRGELELEFIAFNSMDIDIIGRSISVDQPITQSDYTTNNFLNLSAITDEDYQPGTEVYQKMENLYSKYQSNLQTYNQNLEDYNAWNNNIIRKGMGFASSYVTGGLSNLIIGDSLITWLYKTSADTTQNLINISQADTSKFEKKLTDETKKALGKGFDFLTAQIFGPKPSKPNKPTIPVASYEESVYKGTISRIDTASTSPLFIPGTLPAGYGAASVDVPPFKYPAYNEVLGLVSLLKTPNAQIQASYQGSNTVLWEWGTWYGEECTWQQNFSLSNNFAFRFTENIDLAFNPALDFDFSRTKTFVLLEIEIQNEAWATYTPKVQIGSNLSMINSYKEATNNKITNTIYQSEWVSLETLNQMVFSLNDIDTDTVNGVGYYNGSNCNFSTDPQTGDITSRVNSIKVKFLNDMYFNQIGSNDVPVNTTQAFSYLLYDRRKSINHLASITEWNTPSPGQFDQYIPGFISLDSTNYSIWPGHPYISEIGFGGVLYIDAENVIISHALEVANGYSLVIRALNEIKLTPDVSLNPSVQLKIRRDYYSTPVFEYADDNFIYDFCRDTSQYHANISAMRLGSESDRIQSVHESEEKDKVTRNIISIYPNPAKTQIQIVSTTKPIAEIEIFDLSGRSLIHQTTSNNNTNHLEININHLQSGVYIVQTLCGDERSSEKLVVSK